MKIPQPPIALALLVATAGPLMARDAEANAQQAAEIRSQVEKVREQVENEKERIVEAARAAAESHRTLTLAQAGKPAPAPAPPKGPNPAGQYSTRVQSVISRAGGTTPALIIPKEAGDAKNNAELQEDMNVMDHIVDKAAGTGKNPHAMGIFVLNQGGGTPQNLYIEGYGAIFFARVDFPLLPPPDKDAEAEAKDKPNSEWEEARREMTNPGKGDEPFLVFDDWGKGGTVEYNPEKVEDLKKNLLAALKNAANIRKLKSDETVTIIATGTMNMTVTAKMRKDRTGGGGGSGSGGDLIEQKITKSISGHSSVAPPKLIVRAKKSDAEAFQNGKLDFEDFRKKATVMLY